MFDVWTSADDRFQHRQSSQVSLWLAWLARWLRRLPCRLTVQDKSVRKNIFYWISLIKSFDALCKVVYSLPERRETPEISAIFLSGGPDCYVVSRIASSIASDGRASVRNCRICMMHHLCWNNWRRLEDDKWAIDQMTNPEPEARQFVWHISSIRCSLFPSVQSLIQLNQPGQHIWCLNLCRWAPLTQAESRSESETSNTCQMAEEIEMSFDCGSQLVQVCQNHLVSHISSDSLCKVVYIFCFWQTWKSLSTGLGFWVFRQIVLYLPISYQWLKLQDLHVAPPLSEPLKKAGRWQVTHWPNDKC